MKKDKDSFAWNKTIQELAKVNEPQKDTIRVGLSIDEINRILQGEVIQTQYPWLQISRRFD